MACLFLLAALQEPWTWVDQPPAPAAPDDLFFPDDLHLVDEWRSWTHDVDERESQRTFAETVLCVPNAFAEGLASVAPARISVNSLTIFDRTASRESFAAILMRNLLKRETAFLAGLSGSELSTTGVEAGIEEVDHTRFDAAQTRVIFEALRPTYRERFGLPRLDLETVLSAASTGEWIDLLLVPAAAGAFAYRFGVDWKWEPIPSFVIQLHLEKGSRLYALATEETSRRIASLSFGVSDFPLKAIVSLQGGHQGIDFEFIGIGTDLGAVIESVNGRKGPHQDSRY